MTNKFQKCVFLSGLIVSTFTPFKLTALDLGSTDFTSYQLAIGKGQPAVVVSDVNNDGNKDLIISSYSENSLMVYSGTATGHFELHGIFRAGDNPTGLAAADVNGDGSIDVAIANHETSYVTFMYGDGTGAFKYKDESQFKTNIIPHPHEVHLRDINGDSLTDLIVDSRDENGLRVFSGTQSGPFNTNGKLIAMGGDPYRGFAIADLNNDKKLDIVSPNSDKVAISFNFSSQTEGQFKLQQPIPSKTPFSVVVGDLNGDGYNDIITASNNDNVSVLYGNKRGVFSQNKMDEFKTERGAKQLAIGDINGDKIADAIITNWAGQVYVIFGSRDKLSFTHFSNSATPHPWSIALTDFNRDGKSDFVIADGNGNTATVFISKK